MSANVRAYSINILFVRRIALHVNINLRLLLVAMWTRNSYINHKARAINPDKHL